MLPHSKPGVRSTDHFKRSTVRSSRLKKLDTERGARQSSRRLRITLDDGRLRAQNARFLDVCRTYLTPESIQLLRGPQRRASQPPELAAALQDKVELEVRYAELKLEWKELKHEAKRLAQTPATVRALEAQLQRLQTENERLRRGAPRVATAMETLAAQLDEAVNQ